MATDRCFLDGDFTVAKRVSVWRTENPFDFQPQTRIYRGRFRQLATHFAELPINSPFIAEKDDTAAAPTGNFTLRFHGQVTANIAVSATPAAVEASLRALAIIAGASAPVLKAVTGAWPDYRAEFFINKAVPSGQENLMGINATGISPAYQGKVTLASHADKKTGQGAVQAIALSPASTSGISRAPVLIKETPREARGRLYYWDRVYANVPQNYVEYQGYNYQMQRMQTYRILWNSWTDAWGSRHDQYINFIRLSEYSEPLTATVAYSFCLGNQLGKKNAPFYIPFRIIHYTDSFGVEYVYAVGTYGVAEGTDATRWMGDIWRVKNVLVSPY